MPIKPPTREDVRVFRRASDFRAWLEANHASADSLFVGYYKKHVPKTAMTYPEAVEEALCFGWIDGITYRLDDELTATRFTPRRAGSNWSAINIERMQRLMAAGRVHPAGRAAFEARKAHATASYSYENRLAELPAEYLERLQAEPAAWRWWQAQSPSYRRGATWWVVSAKQEATRERRMGQLIADSAAGRPIRPMLVTREQRAAR
jgi:uncharacterized protein YdeI (YjbR/CyaY-like superfamily)